MRLLALVRTVVVGVAIPVSLAAQFGPPPSGFTVEHPVLRRLWALGMDSSHTHRLAQVLFDSLGPRLTASPGMEAAQRWLVQTYQAWGVEARTERYGTWRGWHRGTTHLDLVAPRVRSLEAMLLAWSPGTPRGRPVRAPVIALPDVADSAAFRAWLPQARGRFVLASFPQPTCRPDDSWEKWATQPSADSLKARRTAAQQEWTRRLERIGVGTGRQAQQRLQRQLEAAGAAGVLTNTWSQGWGVDKIFDARTDRTPVLDVSCEDYGLVYRLAAGGQNPVVELNAQAQALGEVPVFNVVA